jgi:hypothetical protein
MALPCTRLRDLSMTASRVILLIVVSIAVATLWFAVGFLADPFVFVLASLVNVAVLVTAVVIRRNAGRTARTLRFPIVSLVTVGISWSAVEAGIASFPRYVLYQLPEYERVATLMRDQLARSAADTVTISNPRWDLNSAFAKKEPGARIEVMLAFPGAGRLVIFNGARTYSTSSSGSCLVPFAPGWSSYRACPRTPSK